MPEESGDYRYHYGRSGQLTAVERNGQALREYGYDGYHNRTVMVEGEDRTEYCYNAADQLVQKMGPAGRRYWYDLRENLTEIRENDKLSEEDMLLLLKKELEEMRGETYEKVQDKLVELASVYGNMFIKKVGGRWEYNSYNGGMITNIDIPLSPGYPILTIIIDAWQKGEENLIIHKYNNICGPIVDWVRGRRKSHGENWQPPGAKYKIPPL